MPEPFLGEIRIFAGDYPPDGWSFCNGQLLAISRYPALFSILGIAYGGNGTTNFSLPNLSGCAPLHQGAGLGLTPRVVGEMVGEPTVALKVENLPSHAHQVAASASPGSTVTSTNNVWAESPPPGPHKQPISVYAPNPNTAMNPQALSSAGGNQPHNNMQPYLGVNFIIALEGEFPSRG